MQRSGLFACVRHCSSFRKRIQVSNERMSIFNICLPPGSTGVFWCSEGLIGKARFVWADTSNAWNGKDSILCDHYRLDINITDKSDKFLDRTDYFMEEILADGVVRELWVSRKKPKRIIRASLKTTWFPVSAIFNE